jgi:hypothetical protein
MEALAEGEAEQASGLAESEVASGRVQGCRIPAERRRSLQDSSPRTGGTKDLSGGVERAR